MERSGRYGRDGENASSRSIRRKLGVNDDVATLESLLITVLQQACDFEQCGQLRLSERSFPPLETDSARLDVDDVLVEVLGGERVRP